MDKLRMAILLIGKNLKLVALSIVNRRSYNL